jgi:addiction module HigA family antidote
MQKKQTPGTALNALIQKHGLNYNRVAKVIGLSSAMVRLIALDENPISSQVAFRLAKFFKNKPEYWLALQMEFDISQSANDKKLAKILKDIPTVDKATFERKKKAKKAVKPVKKAKPAKKAKAAKPKAAKAKTTGAAKRGRPAKSGKPAAKQSPAVSAINEPML